MVNTLEEGNNGLVNLDYSSLLKTIITVLQNQETKNPFSLSKDGKKLLMDIDEIAFLVASQKVENPLSSAARSAKVATVNFSEGLANYFVEQVQQIREILKQKLQTALELSANNISIEDYVAFLTTELTEFQGKSTGLSLVYPFDQKYSDLQKQRLSLQNKDSNNVPLLDFHRLTLTVENTHDFQQQLKASLNNFIELRFVNESPDDRQELEYILDDLVNDKERKSDFYRLIRFLNEEALGKLQREARVSYLEYLKEHIGEDKDDIIYLEDLIRRLRLIDSYINDPDKEDGHYIVNYQQIEVNFQELFNRANAFDMVPIIPVVEGYLGESNDEQQGKKQFTFGLKLKLNGKSPATNQKPSFDYYLDFLDSESQVYKEELEDTFTKKHFVEKILKIAFLYYFIFASPDPSKDGYKPEFDLKYDPIPVFEQYVLPILKGSNDEDKQRRLKSIKKGLEDYKIAQKIAKLKNLLTKFIKKTRSKPLQARNYTIHISIKRGILEQDYKTIAKNSSFFKSALRDNQKAILKYISIESSTVDNTSLCALPAQISISDIQYFSTGDSQSFSMEYDLSEESCIPCIVASKEDDCRKIYNEQFKKHNSFVFPYDYGRLQKEIFTEKETIKNFIYQITFALLVYTSLKVLLDSAKRRLFIPILRFHLGDKQNPYPEEEFMRSIFYVISHLLNETHRSNCQGYCIKDVQPYKTNNALSSLYSKIPKVFKINEVDHIPKLEKLAIIVVSSRECDRSFSDDYKIANLYGKIIGINRQQDNSIRLYTIGTFSDNCRGRAIHTHPDVLIDEVDKLYKQGYKHLLYIAKSPYSTTLNMTETDKDEELYFMSPSIIRSLKNNREDFKIYPVFYDKYFVVKLNEPKVNSLYIQDTAELTNLVKDPHKKSVVFFNLFNGITVAKDTHYNGVISYATLLNFYKDILDDTDIYTGLIDDSDDKNDLLQYLTLYHFSQYEKTPNKNQNISFKLDPYENIIGDKSIGALASSKFYHMGGNAKFNALAFLTEVRKALNVKPEEEC